MKKIFFGFLCLCTVLGWGKEIYPVVILGSGVGGLTAATHLGLTGVDPAVITGESSGGKLMEAPLLRNWPGEWEITGAALIQKLQEQAQKRGSTFISGNVVGVDFSKKPFEIYLKEGTKTRTIYGNACIIAMGTQENHLNVKGESSYWLKGISPCAICDGALYRNKTVAVIGGGASALSEVDYLSSLAKKVYVVLRKKDFSLSEKKQKEVLLQEKKNVEILPQMKVKEIFGNEQAVEGLVLQDLLEGTEKKLFLDGVFLAVGASPNTKIFQNQLELDGKGFISLKTGQETSISGVFAVGDISRPVHRLAILAAADGSVAADQAIEFLEEKGLAKTTAVSMKEKQVGGMAISELFEVKELEKVLKETQTPVFVDFYATWCGPCQRLSPILERFAQKMEGKIKLFKVNVDKQRGLFELYKISSMPTLVIFDEKGKMITRKIGSEIFPFLEKMEGARDQEILRKNILK